MNFMRLVHDDRYRLHLGDWFHDLVIGDASHDVLDALVVGRILFDDFGGTAIVEFDAARLELRIELGFYCAEQPHQFFQRLSGAVVARVEAGRVVVGPDAEVGLSTHRRRYEGRLAGFFEQGMMLHP